MSTILDTIDDTLADWHGSNDAMFWSATDDQAEGIPTIYPPAVTDDSTHGAFTLAPARPIWFDKQGHPIDASTANELLGNHSYARVALTRITSRSDRDLDVRVSTVWLGVNCNFLGGPPVLFETMVFGGGRDGAQWRWGTEEQALAGHARVVAELAASVPRRRVEDCARWFGPSALNAAYHRRQRNRRGRR